MKKLSDIFPKEYVEKRTAEFEAKIDDRSSSYWDILAEMQYFGGFGAVRAVLDNYLTIEQANALLASSRRLYASRVYDMGVASLAGNNGKQFNKIMNHFIREAK